MDDVKVKWKTSFYRRMNMEKNLVYPKPRLKKVG